jgi:NAD(P)H-flavin reductase
MTAKTNSRPAGATQDPMLPIPCHVRRVERETGDTVTFELVREGNGAAVSFAAGQFNMLYAFGVGEVPISISGDPTDPAGRWVHTIRDVGPVTHALSVVRKDDVVGLRGPYGSAWPVREAEGSDLVLMAGGIGLAPLRPALYAALARRERYGRIVVLYGARSPGDLLYVAELRAWRQRFDLEVEVTVDHAIGDWRGHVGVVTELLEYAPFDPGETTAVLCGPEVMMRFSAMELENRGVAPDRVHLSMERNMKCAVGFCGHCQFGADFICKDGPVFRLPRVRPRLTVREL